jgi:hypothetical protein
METWHTHSKVITANAAINGGDHEVKASTRSKGFLRGYTRQDAEAKTTGMYSRRPPQGTLWSRRRPLLRLQVGTLLCHKPGNLLPPSRDIAHGFHAPLIPTP